MKRIIAMVLVCLLLGGSCLAAEWPEGRSAAQPYSGTPEVDLTQTMGYIILFPRAKMPARVFCDRLAIYLPREDVKIGEGTVRLMETIEGEKNPVEVCAVDFADEKNVEIRAMSESELTSFMWGGGVCVQIRLPKSLEFGEHSYHVTMDEGCFTAANGTVKSLTIAKPEAWAPVIEGEYGISGLYYGEAVLPEAPEETEEEAEETEEEEPIAVFDAMAEEEAEAEGSDIVVIAPQPAEAPEEKAEEEAAEEAPVEEAPLEVTMKANPEAGDKIVFDLVMGGDAASAVIYSENGSVEFPEPEYAASGRVVGDVLKDELSWSVLFLNAAGDIIERVDLGR